MAAASPTFEDLEKAVCCLIQIIKDTPDLRCTKVVVTGDMAVRKYLPEYRHESLQSIDLIVNSSSGLLRKKLLQHPMSPLVESSQILFYQNTPPASPTGARPQAIEVRITPEMLCPFLPDAARPAHEVNPVPGQLPYVSLVDLIVLKMDACGLRESAQSKQSEARVAARLLELATEHSALQLTDGQARVVAESLADILRHSTPDKQGKAWWQARLNGRCDPDARRTADQVLTGMIEGMSLDESTRKASLSPVDGEGNWWPKVVGRTSSSSSKTSLASMTTSSSCSSVANFVTSNSPTVASGPGMPAGSSNRNSRDLTCAIPRRSRKFSVSQQSPVKSAHSRKKSVDQGRPKRHSQILGSLPSGNIAHNSSPDGGSPGSPGITLTARFESTPDGGRLISDSYF